MHQRQQSAVRVLTTCGPFSQVAAKAFVAELEEDELDYLAAIATDLGRTPEELQRCGVLFPGVRLQRLLDTVADRKAAEAEASLATENARLKQELAAKEAELARLKAPVPEHAADDSPTDGPPHGPDDEH